MIYTSYFAKIKQLENSNIIPISICGKNPEWYKGLQYKKLIPKYGDFMDWMKKRDKDYYIRCFKEQVLDTLNATDVVLDFSRLAYGFNVGENDIALICYEKPSDFCHRHLVADWLNENGFKCEEWKENK